MISFAAIDTNAHEFRVEVACDSLHLTLLPCTGPREAVIQHQGQNSNISRILVPVNPRDIHFNVSGWLNASRPQLSCRAHGLTAKSLAQLHG